MHPRIRKAVFPVAGLGTRFLPATKTVPKEMLPIIDRPLIQYAVDEAIEAGCDTLIFVTNRYKHAVADYFDKAYELEQKLEKAGKTEQLELIRNVLPPGVRAVFVIQHEALGLGHAVLCAKAVVGNEPFAILLPDDLIWNRGASGALKQMADASQASGASMIAVQDVAADQTGSYGIVATDPFVGRAGRIREIVEKPRPDVAPSSVMRRGAARVTSLATAALSPALEVSSASTIDRRVSVRFVPVSPSGTGYTFRSSIRLRWTSRFWSAQVAR